MEEIKGDLRAIRGDIAEIKTTLAVNTESLVHHVRRTDANEQRIAFMERALITLACVAVLGGVIRLLIG